MLPIVSRARSDGRDCNRSLPAFRRGSVTSALGADADVAYATLEWDSEFTLPISLHTVEGQLCRVALGDPRPRKCLPPPHRARAPEHAQCILDLIVRSLRGGLSFVPDPQFRMLEAVSPDGLECGRIPLARIITPFQKRVFRRLLGVLSGETTSYARLAREVGSSPRAVGGALSRNPWPLIVPCHRVVGTDGGMVGFSAPRGVGLKSSLLALEAAAKQPRLSASLKCELD